MKGATAVLQRKCACGKESKDGASCAECSAKEKGVLQRNSNISTLANATAPPIVHETLKSSGSPLHPDVKTLMESRFAFDFSSVRIHDDARAAESSRAVNALAYTVGRNVVFGLGQYAPQTNEGQKLLAHELTHVVQQKDQARASDYTILPSNSSAEQEADEASGFVVTGRTPQISQSMSGSQIGRTGKQGGDAASSGQSAKPQSCSGWTCLADLNECDKPDPGKAGNNQPSNSWSLTVMIDVDVSTADQVGITTFGHSYVKFSESNGTEYTYGFYPLNKAEVFLGAVKPTPGCIVHPDLSHSSCIDYEEKYSLQKPNYDKALDNAKLWCHSKPTYELFNVNCTTFCAKVVESAGQKLPTYRGKISPASVTADNPNTLLKSLQDRDQANKSKERVLAEEIQKLDLNQELRTAFPILNGQWMVVLLDTLAEINRMQFMDHLEASLPVAKDIDKPRMMAAFRAARLKASSSKPTDPQIDEVLAVAPKLPDPQKDEIRAYLKK